MTCEECSSEITGDGLRFCGRQCSNQASGRARAATPNTCKLCNSTLLHRARTYCNNKCQREYDWLGWKAEIERTGVATGKKAKRYLTELYGHKCTICGLMEWMGAKIPLDLDHIDGNSDNNSLGNLRFICPNCHAQTPTYKARNRHNGSKRQRMRRERYAAGKTF